MIKRLCLMAFVSAIATGCLSGTIETNDESPNPKKTTDSGADMPLPPPDMGGTDMSGTGCVPDEVFFNRTVNTMMTENCSGCHSATGVAGQTALVLEFSGGYVDYLERNMAASLAIARQKNPDFDNRSPLILKPLEIVEHEGGKVFEEDAPAALILAEFIDRADNPTECGEVVETPVLDGVTYLTPYQQLRRATLLLGARLPTQEEIDSVDDDSAALDGIYDDLMRQDPFYAFLERGWNDILHTRGLEFPRLGLDPSTFPDRSWWDQLPEDTDEEKAIQRRARAASTKGLGQGPVKLISYIVRNDKPFTEILTADYEMVNPFSARSYGVLNKLNFNNDDDPDEWLPVSFPGGGRTGIPGGEGYYHSGLLSSSVFWNRYVSTPTNLNRARTRVFFKTFLDTNILELAPRAADADKVVEFTNPIKDFNQCNVCHTPMDPVAGLLQNFTDLGYRRPFAGEWDRSYTPGINGDLLPASRRDDPERWLGEQAIADRRFPLAMVANGYFILTGRERMNPPADVTAIYFAQKQKAFEEQRAEINRISELFVASDYDFRVIIKEWLKSPLLTANNIAEEPTAARAAELSVVGLASIKTPEDLSRKIRAIFGTDWMIGTRSALSNEVGGNVVNNALFYFLFDGIDSRELTKRLKTPNGVNGAVMNVLAEDLACKTVAKDFAKPRNGRGLEGRLLFPLVDMTDSMETNEAAIRENLVYLYERVLGERLASDDPEIDRAADIWKSVQEDGVAGLARDDDTKYALALTPECRADGISDVDYTVRAWQSVLVYMLSDYSFFYE